MTQHLTCGVSRQKSGLQLCVLLVQAPRLECPACKPNSNVIRVAAEVGQEGNLESFAEISHSCATKFPLTLALWSVLSMRPRCYRCSNSLNHACLETLTIQNAKNLEIPRCSMRDSYNQLIPCPSYLLPLHAHANESASFLGTAKPGVPWPKVGSGVEMFPELSCLPGTCRISLGHECGQNLWTRRKALGDLPLTSQSAGLSLWQMPFTLMFIVTTFPETGSWFLVPMGDTFPSLILLL